MRRSLGYAVLLLLSLTAAASPGGNLGLRAEWRDGGPLAMVGFASLSSSWDGLSAGASLNLPFPGLDWDLVLRGAFARGPLGLSLQGGLAPSGLRYIHEEVRLSLEPEGLPEGELRWSGRLSVYIRDPLGTPSLDASGSSSLFWSWEGFWLEASISAELYPFPPLLGRKGLSLGYRPSPWWVTLRSYFSGGWDYSLLELGYREAPLGLTVQGTFGPQGFQRASVALSLDYEPLRFRATGGFTPSGPVPLFLSLGYAGELVQITLRANISFPFHPQSASLEVRLPF